MKNEVLIKAKKWINEKYDEETSPQLQEWINNKEDKLLQNAFSNALSIGYDGWRKEVGPGVGNFNKFSVSRITQALINYLQSQKQGESITIALAYDGRKHSNAYAQEIGKVISGNHHLAYYFPFPVPSGMLSYFIRQKRCSAGIMITASDDAANINGLKLFGADGSQLDVSQIAAVIKEAGFINNPEQIAYNEDSCLIMFVPEAYEDNFIDMAASISIKLNHGMDSVKIIFSPLNGNGTNVVPEMLSRAGFENVFRVSEQSDFDENFSTIKGKPSPENIDAYSLSIELAKIKNADIIVLSDPDCDKFGIACKNINGSFEILSSNEVAILLLDFLLSNKTLNANNSFVLKSITTTAMLNKIAKHYGSKCIQTAPEFSSIIAALNRQVLHRDKKFIAAVDLNMSFLISDTLRDKDAVTAIGAIMALANTLKNQQMTLPEKLDELYHCHGFYYEDSFIINQGNNELLSIENIFQQIIQDPPQLFSYIPILSMENYSSGTSLKFKTNETKSISTILPVPLISLSISKGKIFLYPLPARNQLQCIVHIWRDPIIDVENYKTICARKGFIVKKELKKYILNKKNKV